jgi:hypothetical protein
MIQLTLFCFCTRYFYIVRCYDNHMRKIFAIIAAFILGGLTIGINIIPQVADARAFN